ncbi:hypothetical protein FHS51_001739 [Sphingobium wenxiniae]|uniref:hypothetical protein n=1 Tax=Sphingobium wenxiniae (strain DSM 21828 / CGMCC 1.7748 / JZ-1) TaxID=595605 RepID=UPI0011A08CD9|nr:hypothetical protein [Sphingobium wenxiniae]MBB6191512.1 hypothetical protein [Sphingobium wenxiniae]
MLRESDEDEAPEFWSGANEWDSDISRADRFDSYDAASEGTEWFGGENVSIVEFDRDGAEVERSRPPFSEN